MSINLRHGVSADETTAASLAGAGFSVSSSRCFTPHGRRTIQLRGPWSCSPSLREDTTGLLGKHRRRGGAWLEENAGVGSTADSFYEYLAAVFLYDDAGVQMFQVVATAAEAHAGMGLYGDVDFRNGATTRPISDSLQGFWPGLLAHGICPRRKPAPGRGAHLGALGLE